MTTKKDKKMPALRAWDGPAPLTPEKLADIRAMISSGSEHITAVLLRDCTLLMEEVDRLEYELRLAHGRMCECPPKKPKRRAPKRKS